MPITSYPQSFKEKLIAYYKLCINEVFDNITDDQLFSKNLTALLPNKVYFTKQVATHFNISYDETLYFLKGNYYLTEAKKLIYLKRGKIVYTEYTKNKSFDTLIQRTGLSKVQLYPFYRFYENHLKKKSTDNNHVTERVRYGKNHNLIGNALYISSRLLRKK